MPTQREDVFGGLLTGLLMRIGSDPEQQQRALYFLRRYIEQIRPLALSFEKVANRLPQLEKADAALLDALEDAADDIPDFE